jgi:hypothetical protein
MMPYGFPEHEQPVPCSCSERSPLHTYEHRALAWVTPNGSWASGTFIPRPPGASGLGLIVRRPRRARWGLARR